MGKYLDGYRPICIHFYHNSSKVLTKMTLPFGLTAAYLRLGPTVDASEYKGAGDDCIHTGRYSIYLAYTRERWKAELT